MRNIRRTFKILFLVTALTFILPVQRVQAMDPVTLAILAPVALQTASAARPLVVRSIVNTTKGIFKVCQAAFRILYLPYGLLKMMFGFPFGGFHSGLVYFLKGCIAPFLIIFRILLLPLYMLGFQFNVR
jgi:hypothetical protein